MQICRTGTNIAMANRSRMTVVGEADIRDSYGKFVHETTALVSSDVRYSLLLSWHDLQFLDVLSRNFPASASATVSESIRKLILGEFQRHFKCNSHELSSNENLCSGKLYSLLYIYTPSSTITLSRDGQHCHCRLYSV